MNTIIKRNIENPFRLIDEIFNENRNQTKNAFVSENHKGNMPRVNIIEKDKQFLIEMAVPGMDKSDLMIKIEQNVLIIESKKEFNERQYTHFEYSYDTFERKFLLPEAINSEKISAECKNGLLTVIVPKNEDVIKNKEIKIS